MTAVPSLRRLVLVFAVASACAAPASADPTAAAPQPDCGVPRALTKVQEDPFEDMKHLQLSAKDSMFVITSAGDNALQGSNATAQFNWEIQ